MEKPQTSKIAKAVRNEAKAKSSLKWRADTEPAWHAAWRSTRTWEITCNDSGINNITNIYKLS